MSRFGLKELLKAATAVSVGLGLIALAYKLSRGQSEFWSKGSPGGLIGMGAMTIGFGVAILFNKSWKLGFAVGSIIGIVTMYFLLATG